VNGRDLLFGAGSTSVTNAVQDVTPGAPHAGRQGGRSPTSNGSTRQALEASPGICCAHWPTPGHSRWGAPFSSQEGAGGAATDTLMRLDPAAVSLNTAGHPPAARSDFGVVVVGSTAYLEGGESPKPVDTMIQVRSQAGGTP